MTTGITIITQAAMVRRKHPLPALALAACVVMVATARPSRADIDNTASAIATYGGAPVASVPYSSAVPVAAAAPSMTVTKTPSISAGAIAGQVITYTYVVKNTGKVTLTGIALSDAHSGSGPAPVPGNEALTSDAGVSGDSSDATANDGVWSVLAPGDQVTFTATYTVTQSDVDTQQ